MNQAPRPNHFIVVSPCKKLNTDFCLLFLHEALGSIGQWKSFPQQLCDLLGADGIVYERQGHGESKPLAQKRDASYLHKAAYEELETFIDQNLKGRKYLLVGHSDGASIALLHAAKFPTNCIGVISMAAHIFVEEETLAGIYPAIDAFENGKLKTALEKYHGDKTNDLFYAWSNTWLSTAFETWNIEAEIATINCPVLAIQGQDDQYGTEAQLDGIVSAIQPGMVNKLFMPNCGHAPHLEASPIVLQAIANWASAVLSVSFVV